MSNDPGLTALLRARAMAKPLSWHAVARRSVAHGDRLSKPGRRPSGPQVSVVMAVWNAAPYVEEAVDSILGQTEWHKVRRTGQSRVAVHEKAIIDSVRQSAERALARYVRGQDTEGYPTLRHRPILGLPLEDLRWTKRRAYATALYAWGAAVFARDRRLALPLYCIAKQLVLSCVIAGGSKTWLK